MAAALLSRRAGVIEIDTTRYPLLIQRWTGAPTNENLDAYFVQADDIADYAIAHDSYHVVVVTGSLNITASGRKYLGAWIDTVPSARRERTIASYVVIDNAALRGMLTALGWLTRNLQDVHAVATEAEGIRRATEHLLNDVRTRRL